MRALILGLLAVSLSVSPALAERTGKPLGVGQAVHLKTTHGTYLVLDGSGVLRTGRRATAFFLRGHRDPPRYGDSVVWRTKNSVIGGVTGGREGTLGAGGVGRWRILAPLTGGMVRCGSRIQLRGASGKYVTAFKGGQVGARSSQAGAWETFVVECR